MKPGSQFNALLRAFTRRFVEHELLASRGDVAEAAANVVAILAAFGMGISYLLIQKHLFRLRVSRAQLYTEAWTDQQFLISIAIAVAGLFVIVCWDTLFPDLTDCLVISSLPVRMSTVFAAKLAAVFRVFVLLAFSANAVPLVVFPVLMGTGTGEPITQWMLIHAIVIAAASLFVFCAASALQGVLILVLSYRVFRRLSAYIQFALLLLILMMFFAAPDVASEKALQASRTAATFIPVFWFWGLYQAALSAPLPESWRLAGLALGGIAVSMLVAVLAYSAGYARYVRRTVEGSGLGPAERRARGRAPAARWMFRDGRERALFQFVCRTIARSRMHRLILAGYLSVGLTYILVGLMALVRNNGWRSVFHPNAAVAGAPMVLSFFALLGLRIVFSIPVDLGANWIFRITERSQPGAEFAAVRKLMLVFAVAPAGAASLAGLAALWDVGLAVRHTALMLLVTLIALEAMLGGLRKIPFTCSYLPGKSNLKVMFLVYGVLFSSLAYGVTRLQLWAAGDPLRFAAAVAMCGAALAVLAWRRRRDEWLGFVYDEKPAWQEISMEFT